MSSFGLAFNKPLTKVNTQQHAGLNFPVGTTVNRQINPEQRAIQHFFENEKHRLQEINKFLQGQQTADVTSAIQIGPQFKSSVPGDPKKPPTGDTTANASSGNDGGGPDGGAGASIVRNDTQNTQKKKVPLQPQTGPVPSTDRPDGNHNSDIRVKAKQGGGLPRTDDNAQFFSKGVPPTYNPEAVRRVEGTRMVQPANDGPVEFGAKINAHTGEKIPDPNRSNTGMQHEGMEGGGGTWTEWFGDIGKDIYSAGSRIKSQLDRVGEILHKNEGNFSKTVEEFAHEKVEEVVDILNTGKDGEAQLPPEMIKTFADQMLAMLSIVMQKKGKNNPTTEELEREYKKQLLTNQVLRKKYPSLFNGDLTADEIIQILTEAGEVN